MKLNYASIHVVVTFYEERSINGDVFSNRVLNRMSVEFRTIKGERLRDALSGRFLTPAVSQVSCQLKLSSSAL